MRVEVRLALADDAEQICTVARRSITELCAADHRRDPKILEAWLGNKIAVHVAAWIAGNPQGVFVAAEGESILGVGIVLPAGEIVLNYVSPDARFKGVSKALMSRLVQRANELGLERMTLESTETAHGFYRACGWQDLGETTSVAGMRTYRMELRLRPAA